MNTTSRIWKNKGRKTSHISFLLGFFGANKCREVYHPSIYHAIQWIGPLESPRFHQNEQKIVVEFIEHMKPQTKLLLNVTELQKHQVGVFECIHTLFWEFSSLGSFCSRNLLEIVQEISQLQDYSPAMRAIEVIESLVYPILSHV